MVTRDELKALVEQVPDSSLERIRVMLDYHLHPPAPRPEIERMQRRSQLYRKQVLQRYRETRRPGTCGTGGGSGFVGEHEGVPFGRQGFHYWDDKALVHQSLQQFNRQEIEIMERLSYSPDGASLICTLELTSGGRTVRHEDAFPAQQKVDS